MVFVRRSRKCHLNFIYSTSTIWAVNLCGNWRGNKNGIGSKYIGGFFFILLEKGIDYSQIETETNDDL